MVNLISPVSVVGEPLEADDENLWQHPDVELLGGLLVLFTPWAVPFIILRQFLLKYINYEQSNDNKSTIEQRK